MCRVAGRAAEIRMVGVSSCSIKALAQTIVGGLDNACWCSPYVVGRESWDITSAGSGTTTSAHYRAWHDMTTSPHRGGLGVGEDAKVG